MSDMLERGVAAARNIGIGRHWAVIVRGVFQASLDPEDEALVDHVARAIYAVELARDANCNSLMIRLRGGPGKNDDSYRIEAYEENPEAWRDYARAAIRSMRFAQIEQAYRSDESSLTETKE